VASVEKSLTKASPFVLAITKPHNGVGQTISLVTRQTTPLIPLTEQTYTH